MADRPIAVSRESYDEYADEAPAADGGQDSPVREGPLAERLVSRVWKERVAANEDLTALLQEDSEPEAFAEYGAWWLPRCCFRRQLFPAWSMQSAQSNCLRCVRSRLCGALHTFVALV